ncbi:hypothetical protein WDW86_04485 [Bdellovibrionota bacterium FG-2]
MLYSDTSISCDERGITISDYYLPVGGDKKIAWKSIKSFKEFPLTLLGGKLRVWGMNLGLAWFNCDFKRATKTKLFVLNTGSLIKVAVTPERPREFAEVLRAKIKK